MPSNQKPVSVFHVRNSNYLGGIETTLVGWFKYEDRQNFTPRLQVFKERRGLHERSVKFLEEQGIECEMLPWGHIRNLPGAVYVLWRRVRKAQNPVLQSHDTRSDLVAMIVSWLTGAPLVISNHAWHPAELKRQVLERIRARLMHAADVVISVSRNTHRETLERGVPASRCMAMYSGIDLAPYQQAPSREEARRALGIDEDVFVVGNIARLWPEKEHASLVEAAGLLAGRFPKLRFLIVGDGPLMSQLKEQISKAGLEEVVLMPGYCEDFVAVLAALDIFAFPSSAEGTPMVIYSAMAMGVPIVASPVSGVGEIVVDEESGLFVPPADPDAMAAAIERLIEDSALCSRLGDNAREACNTHYSAEGAIRRLEMLYGELMRRNNRGKEGRRDHFKDLSLSASAKRAGNGEVSGGQAVDETNRVSKRINYHFPVDVETESGAHFTAQTIDLSEEGLQLEFQLGEFSELVAEGDILHVVLNSPFLNAESVQVREAFRVLECIPVGGPTWRVRLQSERSQAGLSSGLSVIRPGDFVLPPVYEELFRNIQAQVNLQVDAPGSRTIMFAGVDPGAGSSTISWWYASCLARTPGRRVLFVDGNMRPHATSPDSGSSMPGFIDVLLGEETLENAVVDLGSGAPGLLNAGRIDKYASAEVSESDVRSTYDLLKENYDRIVIDALPTSESPSTLMWAKAANGCFIVLEPGKTHRDVARASVERLSHIGAHVLGVVLNKV